MTNWIAASTRCTNSSLKEQHGGGQGTARPTWDDQRLLVWSYTNASLYGLRKARRPEDPRPLENLLENCPAP
jgi:hypothetical protein